MKPNRTLAAGAVAALISGAVAFAHAQPGPMGPGYGPGMMGGYGPGYGMGPGMMGGWGQGQGHGYGYGMGPGMMGGWGHGHGMGPGMMGGYGMGPGPMAGRGAWGFAGLNLSDTQRAKIADIQRDVAAKHWELMGKVHEQQDRMFELSESGKPDDAALRKAYAVMAEAHQQVFEMSLDARHRIDAVLTPEQREQWREGTRGRWGGPRPGGSR